MVEARTPRTFSEVQLVSSSKDLLVPAFDPRRIETIYSYDEEDKPQLIISRVSIVEMPKRQLKLASSSKCKLTESNVDGSTTPNYRVEESIVEQRSIFHNFHVLSKREVRGVEVLTVVERHVGFMLTIKKVSKERLADISNEMLFYRLIGEGHPNIVDCYQSVLN